METDKKIWKELLSFENQKIDDVLFSQKIVMTVLLIEEKRKAKKTAIYQACGFLACLALTYFSVPFVQDYINRYVDLIFVFNKYSLSQWGLYVLVFGLCSLVLFYDEIKRVKI